MKDKFLIVQRKKIDVIDEKIIKLIAERVKIAKKIGEYKKNHQLPILDKKRFQSLLEKNIIIGKKFGLDEIFIKKLYHLIHDLSLKIEKNL